MSAVKPGSQPEAMARRQFAQDGFVIVPGLFSEAEVEPLQEALLRDPTCEPDPTLTGGPHDGRARRIKRRCKSGHRSRG